MDVNGDREFVVDASYVLAFLLPDERDEKVMRAFQRHVIGEMQFISIFLLPFDVGNSLKLAVMRKRVDAAVARELIQSFLHNHISLREVELARVWETAEQERLTVYDAAYLTLARQKDIPLLSFDTHLQKFAVQ